MQFLSALTDDYTEAYPDVYSDAYATEYAPAIAPEFILFAFLFSVAVYVLASWLTAKIFEKTGVAGWKAWVPIYNSVVLLKIGGQSPWWLLVALIPFVGIVGSVFMIIAVHRINEGFGRGAGSTVLYVFLPFVWMFMLALGGDRWQGGRVNA